MKGIRLFAKVSIIFTAIALFSFNAWAVPIVSLEVDGNDIYEGDVFDVDVIVDGVGFDPFTLAGDLFAFGFDVSYDSSVFGYIGATISSAFFDDSPLFPDTDVAGSAFPSVGGDGILLATLQFTSLAAGYHSLGIASDMMNLNEGLMLMSSMIPIDISAGIGVDVLAKSNPVPEPSTIILLLAGLLGLQGSRIARNRTR